MAFVNLPPNFQDMFYALSDRIAKLETGPNQAMYTAEAAQGSSTQATAEAAQALSQAQAANALGVQALAEANTAIAQATYSIQTANAAYAQSVQATLEAGAAQTSANGKNTIYYGTASTPGVATITGASGNGTSVTYNAYNGFVVGQTVTVSGIANIVGPPITPSPYNLTGVITFASFTQFRIASTATGAYTSGGTANISGLSYKVGDIYFQYNTSSQIIAQYSWNGSSWQSTPITNSVIANLDAGKITAGTITSIAYNNGSGTFSVSPSGVLVASSATITGNITATSGTFTGTVYASSGTFTGTITSSNATITGGSLSVGGNFIVTSAGQLTATGANITGAITATSGSFTGSIYASGGTIGGFTIQSTYLSGSGGFTLYSNGTIDGGLSNSLFYGYINVGGGPATGERFIVTGNSSFVGQAIFSGNTTSQTHFFSPFATNVTSAANGFWVTSGSGRMTYTTASSQRYKHDIVNLLDIPEYDPKMLLSLPVRAFRYNEDYVTPTDDRANVLIPGFIAEEVDSVYPIACDYSETKGPESWNDRIILPAMLALIQDQDARLKILEGN